MTATRNRRTVMKKDNLPLAQLVTSYELFNRASGKSEETVVWYQRRLNMFLRYVGEDCELGARSANKVREYVVYLQGRNDRRAGSPNVANPKGKLSSAYIHGCVRPLRAFASWLHAEGYTDSNRLQAVKPPKIQKKVIYGPEGVGVQNPIRT